VVVDVDPVRLGRGLRRCGAKAGHAEPDRSASRKKAPPVDGSARKSGAWTAAGAPAQKGSALQGHGHERFSLASSFAAQWSMQLRWWSSLAAQTAWPKQSGMPTRLAASREWRRRQRFGELWSA
jgi:hypothetical protein